MMQQTSLMAYDSIKPELGERQRQVYEVILMGGKSGVTNLEISRFLHLPINSITPRTNELKKLNKIKNICKRYDLITKRLCIAWSKKNV